MKKVVRRVKSRVMKMLLNNPRGYDLFQKYVSKKVKSDEELFLRGIISKLPQPVKLIQIGANDGLVLDPVRGLIIDFKCQALFIEADPVCFKSLVSNYSYLQTGNLKFENVAIVPDKGENLIFYSLSDEFRKKISVSEQVKLSRKSSTDKNLLLNYLAKTGISDLENAISEQSVGTKTLGKLIQDYFSPDILVIDTEGLDWYLLDSLDFSKHLPKAILFERTFKPNKEVEDRVLEKLNTYGYELHDFKRNIGAVRKN